MKTETLLIVGALVIGGLVFMKRADAQLEQQRSDAAAAREIELEKLRQASAAATAAPNDTDAADVVGWVWGKAKGLFG